MLTDLARYGKVNHDMALTIKYVDPTYAIRSTPANPEDADMCHRFAHNAVHCVMAGYTDFSLGLVRSYPVMIPLNVMMDQMPKKMKRKDPNWQRLVQSTGQPNFLSEENMIKYLGIEKDRDISRKENYLRIKCKTLTDSNCRDVDKIVGTSGGMNY